MCSWELVWGDMASLVNHTYDETFGSIEMRGHSTDGFCDPWTLRLPYSASAAWLYNFGISSDGVNYDLTSFNPGPNFPIFHGSNGVPPGTGITSSTLPGVWLSMPKGSLVGDLVTVTAHPIGGYDQPPGGALWQAGTGACGCPIFASQTNHKLSFTFTAKVPGTISVFYNDKGEIFNGNFAGAAIDPKVRRRTAPPATPAPTPKPTAKPSQTPRPTPKPTAAATQASAAPSPEASAGRSPAASSASAGAISSPLGIGLAAAPSPTGGAVADEPAAKRAPSDGLPPLALAALLAAGLAAVGGIALVRGRLRRPR
ncbi:MAG: hypothetical protein E6I94_02140 [Chloroflexi bacterium]|nr:MAG: hypothetical protein E6I94_02140 [Chloroflexota bacterium]